MKRIKQIKIIQISLLFTVASAIWVGISIFSCNGSKESCDNDVSAAALAEKKNVLSYTNLGPIDEVLYEKGKEIFTRKCTNCHALDKEIKGPALHGITKRHSEEWVTNLLTSLQKFSQADSIIKHVMEINNDVDIEPNEKSIIIPLTTKEERRAVIEFLRKEG